MSNTLELPAAKPKARRKISIFLLVIFLLLGSLLVWIFLAAIVSPQSSISLNLIPVNAPITTPLAQIHVQHGSQVTKDQNLADIDLSGYYQSLPHAMALVQGAQGANQNNNLGKSQLELRVSQAQDSEAEIVNRIALARHEEQTRRLMVEQFSVDHAKALLTLRGMYADNSRRYRTAQQKELQQRQKLESAKAAFELASRTRTAVEGELYKIREERQRSGQNVYPYSLDQSQANAYTLSQTILAPANGTIIGSIPSTGSVVQKDSTLFSILPESQRLYVQAQIPTLTAQKFSAETFTYILLNKRIFTGTIVAITPATNYSLVSILVDDSMLSFEQIMTLMEINNEENSSQRASNDEQINFQEKSLPVTVIFWPKDIVTSFAASLANPLLALYEKI